MTDPMVQPLPRRPSFWIPILICLGINAAILAGIAINNPAYLFDYRLNTNPDAPDYVLLGHNALLHGQFSRSRGLPFVPDMLRTPIYPLFSGALDLMGRPLAIYLAQALLQATSCAVIYTLVNRHFGSRTAFFAALFLATDEMWAISNFEALSEPLFAFLLLSSLERLSRGLPPGTPRRSRRWAIGAAGLLLGLATLTRPVALYLLACYVPIVYLYGRGGPRATTRLVEPAILAIAALILPAGWIARNHAVFSVPRLTSVDLNNLVYFVGAGAYQVERGLEREPAQRAIAEEFGLLPYTVYQSSQSTDYPVARMVADLRQAWPRVVFKYPRSLCVSSALAVVKAIASHNVGKLAEIIGRAWHPPGTGDLIRLRSEAFGQLVKNGAFLVASFGWELAHTALSWGVALIGIVTGLKSRDRRWIVIHWLAGLGYTSLTIALFGVDAYFRCRFPALPFLYLFAGLGADYLATNPMGGPMRRPRGA